MIRDFRMNQPMKALLYLFLMFSMITACSQNLPTKPVGSKLVPITLRVSLEQSPQLDPIASLLLTVTATDMDTILKTIFIHHSSYEDSLAVPAGKAERSFVLAAKNLAGKTLYHGSASAKVEAGKTANIEIELVPAVLMIKMTPRYQSVKQNEIVDLNIEVYQADSLFGASFRVEFNSSRLQYLGTDLPSPQGILGAPESVIFFDTSGTDYVAVSITRMYPDTMVSGSGALAQLRFRAISPGTTKLTFAPTTLRLVKKDGQSIPGFDSCVVDEATCEIQGIQTGTITGIITDATNSQPLAGVIVQTQPVTESLTTDSNGSYIFEAVEPNEYTITASMEGYNTKSIDLLVEKGKTARGDMALTAAENDFSLFKEDFEDNSLDPQVTIETLGSFNSQPSIKDLDKFGSTKAFGFGLSTCSVDCFDYYVTMFIITFPQQVYVKKICFKEMELFDNWGAAGKILIDGAPLTSEWFDFSRAPYNDRNADTNYRSKEFNVDQDVTQVTLRVSDITGLSEIYIDDLEITGHHN